MLGIIQFSFLFRMVLSLKLFSQFISFTTDDHNKRGVMRDDLEI